MIFGKVKVDELSLYSGKKWEGLRVCGKEFPDFGEVFGKGGDFSEFDAGGWAVEVGTGGGVELVFFGER